MSQTLPKARKLITLRDAALYITKLPKAEHDAEEWLAIPARRSRAPRVRQPPHPANVPASLHLLEPSTHVDEELDKFFHSFRDCGERTLSFNSLLEVLEPPTFMALVSVAIETAVIEHPTVLILPARNRCDRFNFVNDY